VPLVISGFVSILIIAGVFAKLASIPQNVPPTITPVTDLSTTQTAFAITPALSIPLARLSTNTSTVAIADTSTPSLVATETNTPTPLLPQVVPIVNAFCRKGPGTLYDQVLVLTKGTAYNLIGRDELSSWWQVQELGNNNCWVGGINVNKLGPVGQAKIVQGLPLPVTPLNFMNTFICDIKLKTFSVDLTWTSAQGATGYRIYRNTELLITLAGNLTTYHDNAPLGVDLMYDLEAFNTNGVAARISTSASACK
jgi:hypothetical protein